MDPERYQPRLLEKQVLHYLKAFPVIGLTGPRYSGKSTLLLHLLREEYQYVTVFPKSVKSKAVNLLTALIKRFRIKSFPEKVGQKSYRTLKPAVWLELEERRSFFSDSLLYL